MRGVCHVDNVLHISRDPSTKALAAQQGSCQVKYSALVPRNRDIMGRIASYANSIAMVMPRLFWLTNGESYEHHIPDQDYLQDSADLAKGHGHPALTGG